MKANSTHISLKTAKLLKDCNILTKKYYTKYYYKDDTETIWNLFDIRLNPEDPNFNYSIEYPAYTWGEILWEYPREFFGEKGVRSKTGLAQIPEKYYEIYPQHILQLLQQKKYDEADQYFRDKCILIKK